MNAIGFNKTGSVSNLEIVQTSSPSLSEGEVKIKFIAGSLNHLDLWILKGLPHIAYQFPHICGADIYGEVIESKSSQFKMGDRVILYPAESEGKDAHHRPTPENLCSDFKIRGENAPGVFQEQIIASQKYVFCAPSHLSPEEAASLPLIFLTAWQMAIEKGDVKNISDKNIPILVHGAGSGVTQALLEILISFDFKNIAVTSRAPEKLISWQQRGIQGFVLKQNDFSSLKSWLGKERVALIFDHVGSVYFDSNIKILRTGGKYITCGSTSGAQAPLDLRHLFFRQLQLLGSTMGSLNHFQEMLEWVNQTKLKPHVGHSFKFNDFEAAFTLMDIGKQNGKIVLTL